LQPFQVYVYRHAVGNANDGAGIGGGNLGRGGNGGLKFIRAVRVK
jgi:hypothetical protein